MTMTKDKRDRILNGEPEPTDLQNIVTELRRANRLKVVELSITIRQFSQETRGQLLRDIWKADEGVES